MPDLPSTPRKSVSSTSAQLRSSQKKSGAPKPKGAVRAKSGCYTCRIRRKKCDEQPNTEGACQTCVRLRLQCLGFGAKRPDWMRENNSVTELREKIKTFLASQGMIKGHSGSGPRASEQEPQMLVLVDNLRASPSSPPTPTLSASSSDGHRPHNGLATSFVRDGSHYPPMQPEPPYSASRLPAGGSSSAQHAQQQTVSTYLSPASSSTPFSAYYNFTYDDEDLNDTTSPTGPVIPPTLNGYALPIAAEHSDMIQYYLQNVLPIQYLLADSSISAFMLRLLQESSSARDAACALSSLHLQCVRFPSRAHSSDVTAIFRRIESTLSSKSRYNEGDAMAGLHIVSTFLFTGGRGAWMPYLDIASQFVDSVLTNPRFYGPEEVLRRCSESTRFIIKTTMWFDVLASVTTQQVPRFLATYRQLFGRSGAYIDDPLASAPEISMLPVMGCENHIVLAIAEISSLAHWKESHRARGCLSVPRLVERGVDIENRYLSASAGAYAPPDPSSLAADPDVAARRQLTNDIFRASARVYLHTVLSGDFPSCPEIIAGVAETIECLRRVPTHLPAVSRGVVRSVVFGICICGCLTDDPRHRAFLLKMLESQQGESVGNVSEVRKLMEDVWARRECNQGGPVNWRDVMRESQRDLLLLV
ncbi:fungal-specific transcription factor domain-containing protein [Sparassis latifolia]